MEKTKTQKKRNSGGPLKKTVVLVFSDEMWGYLENMVMDLYPDQVVIKKEDSSGDELQEETSSSDEEEDELDEEENENEVDMVSSWCEVYTLQ